MSSLSCTTSAADRQVEQILQLSLLTQGAVCFKQRPKSQFLFMYALVAMQENKLSVPDCAFVSRLKLFIEFNAAVKIYAI